MNKYDLRRVGMLPGGLNIFVALGFREEESGALVLPIDANIPDLEARKLELEIGLDNLKKRIASGVFTTLVEEPKGKDKGGPKSPKKGKKEAPPPGKGATR
jgi:hypothetical protein